MSQSPEPIVPRGSSLRCGTGLRDEILLAEILYDLLASQPEIEPFTQALSTVSFRFVPRDLQGRNNEPNVESYLDELNRQIQIQLNDLGERWLVGLERQGHAALGFCAAELASVRELQRIPRGVISAGRRLDVRLRPIGLQSAVPWHRSDPAFRNPR